jgi:hypothetical protein
MTSLIKLVLILSSVCWGILSGFETWMNRHDFAIWAMLAAIWFAVLAIFEQRESR